MSMSALIVKRISMWKYGILTKKKRRTDFRLTSGDLTGTLTKEIRKNEIHM